MTVVFTRPPFPCDDLCPQCSSRLCGDLPGTRRCPCCEYGRHAPPKDAARLGVIGDVLVYTEFRELVDRMTLNLPVGFILAAYEHPTAPRYAFERRLNWLPKATNGEVVRSATHMLFTVGRGEGYGEFVDWARQRRIPVRVRRFERPGG